MESTYGTMYFVADMKRAVNFYRETLGVAPSHESEDWTEFSFNGHSLCLHKRREGHKATENGILIFKVDGVKNAYEKMKAMNLNVFDLHEIHPGGWTFHMKDLDQNEFSFYGAP